VLRTARDLNDARTADIDARRLGDRLDGDMDLLGRQRCRLPFGLSPRHAVGDHALALGLGDGPSVALALGDLPPRLDPDRVLPRDAALRDVGPSAGEEGAVVEEEEGVVVAALDGDDPGTGVFRRVEGGDVRRAGDDDVGAAVVVRDARLPVRIQSPGVAPAERVLSVGRPRPGADEGDVLEGESLGRQTCRRQSLVCL
jgi:hypothetical protein